MPPKAVKNRISGFTLSELLIALAILGVIAVFAIPKVLQSQQDTKSKSIAKETAAMISEAYQIYRLKNTVGASMSSGTLTPYLNYVKVETGAQFDALSGDPGSWDCDDAVEPCLRLHNGALLKFLPGDTFNGTGTSSAIHFYLDADGTYSGVATGNSKSMEFFLYTDGSIRTWKDAKNPTCGSWASNFGPNATADPPWFSWN